MEDRKPGKVKTMLHFESTYNLTKINAIIALAGFIMGMDITSLIVFLDKSHFIEYFGIPSTFVQGLLVGSNPLGGLIGCVLYGAMVGKMGRVALFQLGSIIWLVGSSIAIVSMNLWMIVISRWVKGLTVGLFSILLVAYVSEIFPKMSKGRAMSFVQFAYTLSILLVYYSGVAANQFQSHISFKIIWGVEMFPAILFLLTSCWLPETPQWLTISGDYSKAEEIQNKISLSVQSKDKDLKIPFLNKLELACLYGDGVNNFRYKDLFGRQCWRQTLMGFSLQMLVQFSGINFLMYYLIYICDIVGLDGNAKIISSSIPYGINMFLSIIPVTYLDRIKRKDLTSAGSFPLCTIMFIIGIVMAVNGHAVEPNGNSLNVNWAVNSEGGPLILGLCFLFVSIFSLTLSCGPWLYTNEILPTRAKPKGFALCMLVGWLTNFILTLLGPLMIVHLKWGTFILFGSLTLVVSILIIIFFPETKDMNIEEIDNLYGGFSDESKGRGKHMMPWTSKSLPVSAKNSADAFGPIEMNQAYETASEYISE